jgi:hypothetical protein
MTILTAGEMTDLKTEINTNDVYNDIRVMVPSYSYTLVETAPDVWYRYPIDINVREVDSLSINRYGRRTKMQSKQVIGSMFAETYCAGELVKWKEPIQRIAVSMIGSNSANTIKALTLKVSQQVDYLYAPAGLSAWASVDNLTLDIDMDGIPRLSLNLTDNEAITITPPVDPPVPVTAWFNVGVDRVDNTTDLIG